MHQQLVNIQMKMSKIRVSYQGRAQKTMKSLNGTDYNIPDVQKWQFYRTAYPNFFKQSIKIIKMKLEEMPYQKLMTKLQELVGEKVEDTAKTLDF